MRDARSRRQKMVRDAFQQRLGLRRILQTPAATAERDNRWSHTLQEDAQMTQTNDNKDKMAAGNDGMKQGQQGREPMGEQQGQQGGQHGGQQGQSGQQGQRGQQGQSGQQSGSQSGQQSGQSGQQTQQK